MICEVCKNIGTNIWERTIHHQTCDTFKESVDLGCYICFRLWEALTIDEQSAVLTLAESDSGPSSDTTEFPTDNESTSSVEDCISTTTLVGKSFPADPDGYQLFLGFNTNAILPQEKVPDRQHWREFLTFRLLEEVQPKSITEGLSESTKSAATFSIARNWIVNCAANHQQCKMLMGKRDWYPTRLLDCGALTDSEGPCKLIETDKVSLDEPYMTLSHCWGSTECLKLTTSNYDQLLHSISLDILPQLYQDAVYITRQLGIRYLWIDSLCIIQQGDELTDWIRESQGMEQIYSNSFCNISAADAPDSDHTLFHTRNPDTLYPQSMSLTVDGNQDMYLVYDHRLWNKRVRRALINSRGWVLQERLLSPRVLYFGDDQILWECREIDATEVYPYGLPQGIFLPPRRLKDLARNHLDADETTEGGLVIYDYWREVVREYADCELSFPRDKLVALSAIAKHVREILQDEYVAGMWRRYLEFELLWEVNSAECASRPKDHRCPSWSWAAVDGQINGWNLDADNSNLLFEVVDLKLEYLTKDNTGLIQGGWLRLRGKIRELMLVRSSLPDDSYFERWQIHIDKVYVSATRLEGGPRVQPDPPHGQFKEHNARQSLYCMPARLSDGTYFGLILEVVDIDKGVYRRLGLASEFPGATREEILMHRDGEDNFPCEEYRDGLHTIRVI